MTLRQVKQAFGDELFLLDGLAALLFDDIYPESDLVAQTNECLELFGGHLILGISDELPSRGDYRRIQTVSRLVDAYNAACISCR